ncbi:hypothetical protein ACWEV4_31365 [Streptomyces sp. NPDC003860]
MRVVAAARPATVRDWGMVLPFQRATATADIATIAEVRTLRASMRIKAVVRVGTSSPDVGVGVRIASTRAKGREDLIGLIG